MYSYMTLASLRNNFKKLFKPDDNSYTCQEDSMNALTEMLFRYITNLKKKNDNINNVKVNFLQFYTKFELLLPQKNKNKVGFSLHESEKKLLEEKIAREQYKREQRMGFDILDIDGDEIIKMYDLLFVCSSFDNNTPFGNQLGKIYDNYMESNIKAKNFRSRFVLDFNTFNTVCPKLLIVNDIKYAFQKIQPKLDKEALEMELLLDKKKHRNKVSAKYKYSFCESSELKLDTSKVIKPKKEEKSRELNAKCRKD